MLKPIEVRLSVDSPLIALSDALASRDAGTRANAIDELNQLMAAYGDIIAGRTVSLSSDGQFPTLREAGNPTSLVFGVADRERVDLRWVQLFNVQDRRQSTTLPFKIHDTYNAITFKDYLQGERIEIDYMHGDQTWFEPGIVAGGLGWNVFWMESAESYTRAKALGEMVLRWAKKKATKAWTIATASGIETTSYDTTGTTQLEKDINTINAGFTELETAMFTDEDPHGRQVEEEIGDQQTFLLYNSGVAGYRERIRRALKADLEIANDNNSVGQVERPTVPIGSRFIPTGGWYMVLPGRKLIYDLYRDYMVYDHQDPRIAGIAADTIGQGMYTFVRGDSNQVRLLETTT